MDKIYIYCHKKKRGCSYSDIAIARGENIESVRAIFMKYYSCINDGDIVEINFEKNKEIIIIGDY